MLLLLFAGVALAAMPSSFWHKLERADANEVLTFNVNLFQKDKPAFFARLAQLSDPSNRAHYGKWMTHPEIMSFLAPPTAVRRHVASQLRLRGLVIVEDGGDHLVVNATAATIERVFGFPVHQWEQKTTARRIVKATGYMLPAWLAKEVEIITGLTELPMPKQQPKKRRMAKRQSTPPDQQIIIPQYLRLLYNVSSAPLSTKASVCVAEFEDDAAYLSTDMSSFYQQMNEPPFTIKNVGPFTGSDTESTLDIQYAPGIAKGAQAWFWVEKDWLHSFAAKLAKAKPIPQVVSMSWGWPEKLMCLFESGPGKCLFTHLYVERTNTEFAKVTAQGVTLLSSSGDQGAPGDGDPNCGAGISDLFPSSSPWVTSVGATMIGPPASSSSSSVAASRKALSAPVCSQYPCATAAMSESVCSYPNALITSGGGFSTYTNQPSWQTSAVNAYFAQSPAVPPSSMFNKAHRAFPDVAANGHNYAVVQNGQVLQVDGTSCSSPVMAGIVAQLNWYRLNAGKSVLGFANPMFYAAPASVFNDITLGNNNATESCTSGPGFAATPGWDACTGRGTPNTGRLLQYVLSLP